METDAVDLDLLAPENRLVSVSFVARELRRHRTAIGAIALAGAFMVLLMGFLVPKQAVADTKVLLQFPAGADPAEAIRTDLELLRTRAVAQAALQALGLETDPEILRAQYDGAILSNRILSISVTGNDDGEAERQADAVAAAYLQVREALYREQHDIVVAQQRRQQEALRQRVSGLSEEIKSFDELTAEVQIDDLLTERTSLNSQIGEIEDTIQTETVATSLIVEGSRVIDVRAGGRKVGAPDQHGQRQSWLLCGPLPRVVLLRGVGCRNYSCTPSGRRCCRDARSGLCQHRIGLWEVDGSGSHTHHLVAICSSWCDTSRLPCLPERRRRPRS